MTMRTVATATAAVTECALEVHISIFIYIYIYTHTHVCAVMGQNHLIAAKGLGDRICSLSHGTRDSHEHTYARMQCDHPYLAYTLKAKRKPCGS